MAPKQLSEKAKDALDQYHEAKGPHTELCAILEKRYRAFRGVLEPRSKSAKWTWKISAPYAKSIVETTLASLLDEKMRFEVRPRPRLWEPGEFAVQKDGARANEILLGWNLDTDRFSEKQRPFVLQNMIAGVTAAKVCWRHSTRMRKHHDEERRNIVDPYTGTPIGQIVVPVINEKLDLLYDGPSMEVLNIADTVWDPGATSLDNCRLIAHRVWKTWEECLEMKRLGLWDNVDDLKGTEDTSDRMPDWSYPDDQKRRGPTRRFEIVEIWIKTADGIEVTTIGNESVQLRQREHPYWHGIMPFVIGSTEADLFRIGGMSQVEKIQPLQEALWTITNQRLDNLSLVNSGIVMFNERMVNDPRSLKFGPMERWVVQGPVDQAVQMWAPNPIPAEISIPAESNLKADMQNLAGGFPFTSTSEARTVKAGTATEAALVSTLAQRSVSQTKIEFNRLYERIGQQFLELNQQYITGETAVTILGADNEYEQKVIMPRMLRGDYEFSLRAMNESLMRQERRAEQVSFMQLCLQAAPVYAALAAQGMGEMINMKAVFEDVLEAFDKHNKEAYFASQAPIGLPPAGQASGGGSGQGTTSGLATDPAVSPSSAMSMSGETAQQRFMAGQGGANNL